MNMWNKFTPRQPQVGVLRHLWILILNLGMSVTADAAGPFFVRPYTPAGYSTGDGLSHASAWNGFRGINWSSVTPGTTVYICGSHLMMDDRDHHIGASGAAGAPVVLDGNCPLEGTTDRGALFAFFGPLSPGAWADDDGDGIYTREWTGCTGSFMLEHGTGTAPTRAQPGMRVTWAQDDFADPMANLANWQAGSFFQQPACSGLVYFKPSMPDAPVNDVYFASGMPALQVYSRSFVTIRNLDIFANHLTRAIEVDNGDHIIIENIDMQWGHTNVLITNDSDNGVIRNNKIHDSIGTAIYFATGGDDANAQSNDGWMVEYNEIYDVSLQCEFCGLPAQPAGGAPEDRHGIGTQGGGSDNTFQWNYMHDLCCEGISFYNWSSLPGGNPQRNNTVRFNFIDRVEDLNARCLRGEPTFCANQRGIELGSDAPPPDPATITGNKVYGNVLARVRNLAFRMKSTKSESGYTWSMRNNTIIDSGTAYQFIVWNPVKETWQGGAEFRNNIIYDSAPGTAPHLLGTPSAGATNADTAGLAIANNIYYPDGAGMFRFGAATSDLGGWAALSGIGESGSAAVDPQLIDPETSGAFRWAGVPNVIEGQGDFRPQATSPAIDAGISEPPPNDILGNFMAGPPDIGAYEHQPDSDGDSVPDTADNCPLAANTNQTDTDNDSVGNACDAEKLTLTSIAGEDGWIREYSETSNSGRSTSGTDSGSTALRIGDASADRSYKAIVSFDTSGVPAGATVSGARLELTWARNVGDNPPQPTFGTAWVDLSVGGIGASAALAGSDFQAVPTLAKVGSLSGSGATATAALNAAACDAIASAVKTQLRMEFTLDDNDDGKSDYAGYYSGEADKATARPRLVISYTRPD